MKMNPLLSTLLLPGLMLLSTSCEKEVKPEKTDENVLTNSLNAWGLNDKNNMRSAGVSAKMTETEWLKSVRQATSRFHSTTQAIKAEYEPDDECVSVPGLGGMGYHWVNTSLVDPVFDPQKPEALLYAAGPGGKLQLVGIEYLVLDIGQARPMFGDQPFDIGGSPLPIPHWTLHVWLYKNNPSGLFAPFNPEVSCP